MDDDNKEPPKKKTRRFLFDKTQYSERNLSSEKETMSDYINEEKLALAASRGDGEEIAELLNVGVDINYRSPSDGCCAIHIAAGVSSRFAVEELMKSPSIDYLIKDHLGRLPSALAMEVANDPELAELLMVAEIAQAEEQGLDYREVLTGKGLSNTDSEPSPNDPSI